MFRRCRCRRVLRLVSMGLDEPLTNGRQRKIEAHLAQCPACRAEAAFYREIKEAAQAIENRPAPDYIWDRIVLQTDEHPWGEGAVESMVRVSIEYARRLLFGRLRPAAVFATGLILALSITMPNQIPGESEARPLTFVEAERTSTEYLSFMLAMESDRFPVEVQDYYLSQLGGLDQRIRTVKTALRRFPENRAIRAQLVAAYQQKITLCRRLQTVHYGISREDFAGRVVPLDKRGCYE
ncbi:MAG: zf-HC2 domain-containing protein [candidate division Zixibacteria bacterium]|nr:zf-HC2 domain-containing protein [candidate division Zixibacteria bacterium]